MKAKHFKKLRRNLGALQTFNVKTTFGLFGDFHSYNFEGANISATSYERAIKIFMRNYRRKYKQKCEHEQDRYEETTEKWGKLMVTNESGFKKFF